MTAAAMKHMASNFAKLASLASLKGGLILNGVSDLLFDVYHNVESSKELWDSLEAKYTVEDASSKKFTQHKMNMDETVQDSDKPKGNNVAGPLVVNMMEHNNSIRMMMLRGGLTQEQLCMCVKVDAGSQDP
uniref:Zinc finger, CCHC-type n=1 Tax=Tanacetum cinerariifolium TaxID=118510 RepID=A0A6L2NHS7_TANCI|nr:zinc finger, CCHC-type [Tanacetum cinerariifolium]